jgi:hypothetical protein
LALISPVGALELLSNSTQLCFQADEGAEIEICMEFEGFRLRLDEL